QDFSKGGFVSPPEFDATQAAEYRAAGDALIAAYKDIHTRLDAHLREKLPCPESMKPEAYGRNIAARAFDVARYCLFWGVPTNVGQVTSIRTLEKQIKRLRVSEFAEVSELGLEIAEACAAPPECIWDDTGAEPIAPTLARHAEPDEYIQRSRTDLEAWTKQNLNIKVAGAPRVD